MSELSLIVGLGNPGRSYEQTRHNVGFDLLDRIARRGGVEFQSKPRWQAHLARLADGTLLLKPQTFMNLSGRAVRQVADFHRWPPQRVLVAYDDIALPLGRLRLREKGSAGGHNGMRSIIEHLGTEAFPRLRIGIGSSQPGGLTGHVLGRFGEDERETLENALATAEQAVQLALARGVAAAANRYNASIHAPENSNHEPEVRRPDRPEHQGD